MASKGTDRQGKPSHSLSEQGHKEVMDLLRLADKSSNPDIRAAAIDIAKQTSKYQRNQGARVNPTLILVANITLVIAAVLACWYAFLHYPERLAYELSLITILLLITVVGISLFLSGYLSQTNFMKILSWLLSHMKTMWSSMHKASRPDQQPEEGGCSVSDSISPKE